MYMTDQFEIRYCARVGGNGLIVTREFQKYDVVYKLKGDIKDIPDKFSIEIGKDQHITDPYGIFINHSFDPTVMINGYDVVALKELSVGSEICFNYNKNETAMACPFETPGGMVQGFNY